MNKFLGAPFYPDSIFCSSCKRMVSNKGAINCELEPKYRGIHEGKCKCGTGYSIITGMFMGANKETYWAEYDSTGTLVTRSGCLTREGKWDEKSFIKIQMAKNFKPQITLHKNDAGSMSD